MEIKRIIELFNNAIAYTNESDNIAHKDINKMIEHLENKQKSLVKIADIINEDLVLFAIRNIIPTFKPMIKVDTEYYYNLVEVIKRNYNNLSVSINERLRQKNITFAEWNYVDTKLTDLKNNLLRSIYRLYKNEKYTDLTEDEINKKFDQLQYL